MRVLIVGASALLLAFPALPVAAQEPNAARAANAELPLEPTRTTRFTTREGTWVSLDVSPDGRQIVFDLAGDLYTMPIAGGKATRITEGMAFDGQPRYSPDGTKIVYVSDRSGSDNLWIADADGTNARALTKMEKRQFVSPEWTPDGKYIVTSRNNSLFAPVYELYLYHVDGGSGIKMTGPAGGAQQPPPGGGPGGGGGPNNYVGAAFGSDPRYVFVAARQGAGGYNQTALGWQVAVYDRETGETYQRTASLGSGMRPVVSPDGKWLVYATRDVSVTSLRLRDLETGDERWLARDVQRDDQESRFVRDLMPGMSFTPDSRSLVVAHHGKIWRVSIPDGRQTEIPFEADVEIGMGPLVRTAMEYSDSSLIVSQVRNPRTSPDGRRIAFTALDKLWVMDLPAGSPRRLTNTASGVGEHDPVWSPDGRYIAYVTWTEEGGSLQRVRADGRGSSERLTPRAAFYEKPAYTPNGSRIVVARGPRLPRIEEQGGARGMELVWLPANGGEAHVISPLLGSGRAHFSDDTTRVFQYNGRDGLVSMRFDGTDRKAHLKVTGYVDARQAQPRPTPADEVLISPTGDRVLVQADHHVYVVPLPMIGGETPSVSVSNPANSAVPVRKLSRVGGEFINWQADGRGVTYALGRTVFLYDLPRADSLIRDSTTRADSVKRARGESPSRDSTARDSTAERTVASADSAKADSARPVYEPQRVDVEIRVAKDRPSGTVALRGARIITMKGDEVIENGDIIVTNNRITAVGARGSVTIPAGTREIDVTGKTIMPGLIDIHAHIWPAWGVHRTQVWEYAANLAYGITATRDPQTATTDVLSYGDMVETGELVGPRVFSTGPGVFWSDDIKSLKDARDVLRRYTEHYHTHTIKQYMVGDRKVRQWVIMASKELGLTPTLEGGLDFRKNFTEAVDGYAGTEHSFPIAPLYEDVIKVLAESGITYTPTLLVEYGGPWAENYWYQRHDILADEKLKRFVPPNELMRRGLRRPGWWHESQYSFQLLAEQAKKLVDAGGRVGLGGHGQLQGLGVHWELWSIASGGMKPMDALRVATIFGAEAIGLDQHMGTLEGGKLADLQVLDANPLDDIRNTTAIRYVMKNGRLYDANTLAEIWPQQRPAPQFWWENQTEMVENGTGK
ncbi:MAG TPA: amidohydrolase family protein [Gemmatimonadaceae bacterium]|nr:amidohydrolase family protein [Gemmatimonadaceae bacterium]